MSSQHQKVEICNSISVITDCILYLVNYMCWIFTKLLMQQ